MIKAIPLRIANEYVKNHHRHHGTVQGCKFSIGLFEKDQLRGVAICGRPVAKAYDNGNILQVNRLCTDGIENGCSKLYSACVRIARQMGYEKVITYILQSENGSSLKASNFVCQGKSGGVEWTGKRYQGKVQTAPHEMKTRWVYEIKKRKGNML